jgi:type II secretory pathway pseudopilin PulG
MQKFRQPACGKRNRQSGYILLMMMLFIALMAIAALAAIPRMEMQIKRDREEEMIHRGAQYARAIRHYVKKFGRYPTSVSDLLETNNVHFLRKAYKDPITGKDFRMLHMQDVQTLMAGAGGFGAAGFGPGGFTGNPGAAAAAGQPGSPAGTPVTSMSGAGPENSGSGNAGDGADSNQSSDDQSSGGQSSNGQAANGQSSGGLGQTFGGGPIMGVASTSKDKSIRVFNNKDHYKDWMFVYDPMNDRALITGPYQPSLATQNIGVPGSTPVNGMNGNTSGFGNQSNTGFGGQPTQQQNPQAGQNFQQ